MFVFFLAGGKPTAKEIFYYWEYNQCRQKESRFYLNKNASTFQHPTGTYNGKNCTFLPTATESCAQSADILPECKNDVLKDVFDLSKTRACGNHANIFS